MTFMLFFDCDDAGVSFGGGGIGVMGGDDAGDDVVANGTVDGDVLLCLCCP
jgi:hypothetical protein